MFNKVLVANRGEVALRIMRACKELGVKTVAVYSTEDANTAPVAYADEAVCIGPAPANQSYLIIPSIIAAAVNTGADAIHPGYGFLAENADFARACADNDIVFIGPSPESIEAMGNKAQARETMKTCGVPTVPGSDGVVETVEEARAFADAAGYPILVKASAGGGGKGMREVHSPEELESQFTAAKTEALAAFGNGDVYLEKLVLRPRHIEVQILADKYDNRISLCERDCSLQRRHQKLLEEAPSPALDGETRRAMGVAAIKAVRATGYENAGTIEFLLDQDDRFYFMEMNTRVQVEHPVTETITGTDIIKEQLRIARVNRSPALTRRLSRRTDTLSNSVSMPKILTTIFVRALARSRSSRCPEALACVWTPIFRKAIAFLPTTIPWSLRSSCGVPIVQRRSRVVSVRSRNSRSKVSRPLSRSICRCLRILPSSRATSLPTSLKPKWVMNNDRHANERHGYCS